MTTLKDRVGHPLKSHLTEIPTWVNNLNLGLKYLQVTMLLILKIWRIMVKCSQNWVRLPLTEWTILLEEED